MRAMAKKGKDKEGKCPNCGGPHLRNDALEVSDDNAAFYPVRCYDCHWTGREWYKMVFDGHEEMK